jgi:hypothetical protein
MLISTKIVAALALLIVSAPDEDAPRKNPPLSSLSEQEIVAFYRAASPARFLAALALDERIGEDDPRIAPVRDLLGRVDAKYREDAKTIVDDTIRLMNRLAKGGRAAADAITMIQVLEGSLEWHPPFIPAPAHGWRFEEFCTQYALLREEKGMDHRKVVDTLLSVERGFYGFAEGDQAKQRAFLKEVGIVPEDDFTTRAHKFSAHMRGLEDGSIPGVPRPKPDDKRASTTLQMGRNLEKAKKRDAALGYYRQVVKEFPGTQQAEEAAGRIKALGGK